MSQDNKTRDDAAEKYWKDLLALWDDKHATISEYANEDIVPDAVIFGWDASRAKSDARIAELEEKLRIAIAALVYFKQENPSEFSHETGMWIGCGWVAREALAAIGSEG